MKTIREVLGQFSDSYEILDSYQRRDLEAAILAERPWLEWECVDADSKHIVSLKPKHQFSRHPNWMNETSDVCLNCGAKKEGV